MEDKVTIETGFGPLRITPTLLALWNRYGWPTDADLKRMVEGQRDE